MPTTTHWTTEPDGYLEPVLTTGANTAPTTVIQQFKGTVNKYGKLPAMRVKQPVNNAIPSEWKTWTWDQYWHDCMSFGKTLLHLNVGAFKVVNVIGFNSPEWLIANTGAMMASAIAAGIYTTNTPEACFYIAEHSKAEVIVCEGNKQLAKFVKTSKNLKFLKAIVVWGEVVDDKMMSECAVPVYSWDQFLLLGSSISDDAIETRLSVARPGNCSTLIYTSGTTGPPKAVMISHDNITWTARTICDNYVDLNFNDRLVSYLPLSHIAAQLIDIHCAMYLGACTYFAQPDALKGTLTHTLKEVRPTFFFGVPRVWEKIQEKMVQIGRETTGIKKILATWAKGLASQRSRLAQYGNGGGNPSFYGCAHALILSKIKAALGLDQAKACFTAAAPISVDTLMYFASVDIPIYEVFGQSECTGPHTVSFAGGWKIGYCGRPIPGSQTMIAPGTNELCYRGRHIFMGYMHNPEGTASTIDEHGYLHSGDVAEFDGNDLPNVPSPSGFMKITGRIKELIITAGGENIPPVLIENEMKAAMVALSNCMVVGDRRKYLAMLVSLKCEVNHETGEPTDILAADALFIGKQIGSTATTMTAAASDPLWIEYINKGVKTGNSKTTSNAQIVQKWRMLPTDFSEKAGDLTPTLKLKRNVVAAKYAELIDLIYADGSNE